MTEEFLKWWPIWSPVLLLMVGGSVAGVWAIIGRRDGERISRRSSLPPTWPEMWKRIDEQDERIDALEELLKTQRAEMVAHIVALEQLIPNPPGPPSRPTWMH